MWSPLKRTTLSQRETNFLAFHGFTVRVPGPSRCRGRSAGSVWDLRPKRRQAAMLAACEVGEVFQLLEGGAGGAQEAGDSLVSLYQAVREPWLTRALLQYHARTGSARALDLLARAPDHHARHLLDALHDQLRADRPSHLHALSALAPLVARRPAWLHRLPPHPLARELLRAARREREPLPLLHALLASAALLCAAPALAAPHWPDLADALLRPAALEPAPPPATRAHLQLAQLALFHALYATHPCTLVEALRAELGAVQAREAWERGLAPLLRSVRLHPALVTGSRQREADAARWARLEAHDVVAESRRLERSTPELGEPSPPPAPLPAPPAPASPPPGSGAHAARALAALRPGGEQWFALVDRCGADSAPHTPLPADADTAEPPEAAVEATPENTPAKETRAQFRFPTDSGAVRAIGRRSRPASPPRKETSPPAAPEPYVGRLSRVMAERRAVDSPVPFGGAPPGGAVARPEPRGVGISFAMEGEPPGPEDREVLELTAAGAGARAVRPGPEEAWGDDSAGGVEAALRSMTDPRLATPRAPPSRAARPARRPASCPPARGTANGTKTNTIAVQTVDTWPEPFEFLIADFYRNIPDDPRKQDVESREASMPCERLDAYLSELYSGGAGAARGGGELAEQLALAHAQLMYERWRREAHAERNRRLLGRCRHTRALELQTAALKERVRALTRERDELRARLEKTSPPTPAPGSAPIPEREASLEAALAQERAARARAEAALHEAEAQRALDQAELQRTRGESFEAARHVEALARAALAAERRAEHVRRLRRELLVLAEREARLGAAAKAAAAGAGVVNEERGQSRAAEERALKSACVRAEAEASASALKAEAAAARAHELEAALGARDAAVAELKRATRHAAEEHAAQLDALRDKYSALMRVVRAAETKQLELLATAGGGAAGSAGGGARRLLEEDDDAPDS